MTKSKSRNLFLSGILTIIMVIGVSLGFGIWGLQKSSNVNAQYEEISYGVTVVKDFYNMEIDITDERTIYYMTKDMLGIDQDTSSGRVVWNGEEKTLYLEELHIYQTEDPLLYDEDGNHKALITLYNPSDSELFYPTVKIKIRKDNEIVNYGKALELKGTDVTYKIMANDVFDSEGALHIQNKKSYAGNSEPAIFADCWILDIEGNEYDTTLILSGVGGLVGNNITETDATNLSIKNKVNLFINTQEEKVYYNEDIDNQIIFDEDEVITPAISGFDYMDISADSVELCRLYSKYFEKTTYDTQKRQMSKWEDVQTNLEPTSVYYLGRKTLVDNYDDLEYMLMLKEENQQYSGNFDNIFLTKDINIEKTLTESGAILKSNGYKRLFLNGHHIYYYANTTQAKDHEDNGSGYKYTQLFGVYGTLEIYGEKPEDNSYIRFEAEENSDWTFANITVIDVRENAKLKINNGVTIWASDDFVGADDDYQGRTIRVGSKANCTIFNGLLKGSESKCGVVELLDQSNVSFKMVSGLIYSSTESSSYQSLIYSNIRYVGDYELARIYGGTFVTAESGNFFDTDVTNYYPNTKHFVKIVGGYNPNMRTAPGGAPLFYNGIYSLDYILENNIVCGDAMWFTDPFYRPYIKTNLPEEVFVDGTDNVVCEIELFNPVESGYTMGKGYTYALFMDYNGDVVPLMSYVPINPHKHISFEEVDGKYCLTIKASLPKAYDDMLVYAVIKNNFSDVSVKSRVIKINVVDSVTDADISLTGPKDAFNDNSNTGAILEMGKVLKENNIKAKVASAYSNVIYVQWFDTTDPNNIKPMSEKAKIVMTNQDNAGRYYTEFAFTPSVSEVGTYKYNLYVWTVSKYDNNTIVQNISKTAKFTVENSAPIILSQIPNEINAIDGEIVTATIEVADNIANIGYKWYYFPSIEYATGIQGNNLGNMDFDGVSFNILLGDDSRQIYKNISGTANQYKVVWHLDTSIIGGINRLVFDCAQDLGQGKVKVKLIAGNVTEQITPIVLLEEEFNAIQGNYEFYNAFQTKRLQKYTQYYDAEYYDLIIDFVGTPLNATHIIQNMYIEHLDQETDVWTTTHDLNPYHFAKTSTGEPANYFGVYELNATGNPLEYTVSNNDDGRYIYCKVFNQFDNTKYVYSYPIKVNVGNKPVTPHITHTYQSGKYFENVNDVITFEANVEQPFLNHQLVVNYDWKFLVWSANGDEHYYTAEQMHDDFGITISTNYSPSTGLATCTATLVNKQLASQMLDYAFRASVTAFSPADTSLTDKKDFLAFVAYDVEGVEISNIYIYDQDENQIEINFPGTGNKYNSKDGENEIKDIIALSSYNYVIMKADVESQYNFYSEGYLQPYVRLDWKFDFMYQGERKSLTFTDNTLKNYLDLDYWEYIDYGYENNEFWFAYVCDYEDDIPSVFRNFVVYAVITNTLTNETFESQRYQLSYVNLADYNLLDKITIKTDDNPDGLIEVSDLELDQATGNINFSVRLTTMKYKSPIYISDYYDYDQKNLYAVSKTNPLDSVIINPTFVGKIYVNGYGYIENWYGKNGDEYFLNKFNYKNAQDALDATFDNTSGNAFVFNVTIPYEFIAKMQNGEIQFTDDTLCDEYYSCVVNNEQPELTAEQETELMKMWFYYYCINFTIDYRLNYNTPVLQLESDYLDYSDFEELFWPEYNYNAYPNTEITVKQGVYKNINGTYDTTDYVEYEWYKQVDGELVFVNTNGDAYVDVDTSSTGVFNYVLKLTLRKTADPEKSESLIEYIPFVVEVEPNLAVPTITNIRDYEFGYKEPNCVIGVEATTYVEGATLAYCFVIDSEEYWTYDNTLAVSTDTLGTVHWYVRVYTVKYVQDGNGNQKEYYSDATTSDTMQYTVSNRVIDDIEIYGVKKPVQGNNPTTDTIKAISSYLNDDYIGYKVISAYWNIGSNQTFDYDSNYTLTVIVELLENCVFDDEVDGYFNDFVTFYECDVTKISATQARLEYTFISSESNIIEQIELRALPTVKVGGLIRPFELYNGDSYAITSANWNIDKGNYEYNKDYKLTLIINPLNGYSFTNDLVVKVGIKTVPYTVTNDGIKLEFDYLFTYSATIKVGNTETPVQADKDGKINLNITNIPQGKMFDGWFVGEQKVLANKSGEYTLTKDGLLIEARFIDIPYQKDGNDLVLTVGENETEVDISDLINGASGNDNGAKINIGEATVELDGDAVKSLDDIANLKLKILVGAENATGNLDAANLSNVKMVVEISLSGQQFTGTATVNIPVNFPVNNNDILKVYYVSPAGAIQNMQATYADGVVRFTTTHFSTYAITQESANINGNDNGDTVAGSGPNIGLIIGIIAGVIVLAGGAFCLYWFVFRNKAVKTVATNETEKEAVVFGEKKTLNEEYAVLTKEDRKLYDKIKAHAMTLEGVKTSEAQDYYTVSYKTNKIVRFKIKKGEVVAEFFANDKEFKQLTGTNAKETASSVIKVKSEEDANKVIEAIDYKFKSLTEKKD